MLFFLGSRGLKKDNCLEVLIKISKKALKEKPKLKDLFENKAKCVPYDKNVHFRIDQRNSKNWFFRLCQIIILYCIESYCKLILIIIFDSIKSYSNILYQIILHLILYCVILYFDIIDIIMFNCIELYYIGCITLDCFQFVL